MTFIIRQIKFYYKENFDMDCFTGSESKSKGNIESAKKMYTHLRKGKN